MSGTPSIRFFYSEELYAETIAVLEAMEQADDPTEDSDALGDLVVALTETGLDYYFLKPLQLADVGFVARQSATFGVASAKRFMAPVIRSIIGGMDEGQLLTICGFIRDLMD